MSNKAANSLQLSFDGKSWRAADFAGNHMPLPVDEHGLLPEVPAGYSVSRLLLPVEMLLCRSFSLPLSHSKLVDADILAQELNECSGEDAEDWWLVWQAAKKDDAVAGLVFGLPESWRLQMDASEQWQQLRGIGIDAWERLRGRLHGVDIGDDVSSDCVALFDADEEGVFFGVWEKTDDKISGGLWRGMRRLNISCELSHDDRAAQIRHSLLAMGWCEDDAASGRLGSSLLNALGFEHWYGDAFADVADQSELPDRHAANLSLVADYELNFRHGRWTAQSGFSSFRPWRRILALAAAVLLVWVLSSLWQIQSMNAQADLYRARITAAFHKGLPDETVMMDALAQLQRAADGGAVGDDSAGSWLHQLAAMNRVYKKTPWTLKELSIRDGSMKMSGKADGLEALNKIREALQQETGQEVTLTDTDISGQQVSFRMQW